VRSLSAGVVENLTHPAGVWQTSGMQHLHLGAIIVDHDHGVPCAIRQVGGAPAHEIVEAALLESDDIAVACYQDDEDNPAELDFGPVDA
jgi:hypothetical protein